MELLSRPRSSVDRTQRWARIQNDLSLRPRAFVYVPPVPLNRDRSEHWFATVEWSVSMARTESTCWARRGSLSAQPVRGRCTGTAHPPSHDTASSHRSSQRASHKSSRAWAHGDWHVQSTGGVINNGRQPTAVPTRSAWRASPWPYGCMSRVPSRWGRYRSRSAFCLTFMSGDSR